MDPAIKPLGVGVIGVGRSWRRSYAPALLSLPRLFRIQAVYDQVAWQAFAEARRLGCDVAASATDLLSRDDIDVLLLADRQWWRLWPIELACRLRKPVFCAAPLEAEFDRLEELRATVRTQQLPVMVNLAPRLAPATARLREVLTLSLGPVQLIVCEDRVAGAVSAADLEQGLLALIDWILEVLHAEPIQATIQASHRLLQLRATFAGGAEAVWQRYAQPVGHSATVLRVVAERGWAELRLPNRIRWQDARGAHAERLQPTQRAEAILLERFHRALRTGESPQPNLDDACRALSVLRAGGWRRGAAGGLAPSVIPS